MADASKTGDHSRTPLYDFHIGNGARMVAFAGYEMPVQYPLGILKEHLHTRSSAGLFDISHMGQLNVTAKSGDLSEAKLALEALIPVDIESLQPGRQRYGFFTNENGGILDDLMIANFGDRLVLVVNAANKSADEAHLRALLPSSITVEKVDRALIALQGPKSESALARLNSGCTATRFMDVKTLRLLGEDCPVSRSGYTGAVSYTHLTLPTKGSSV